MSDKFQYKYRISSARLKNWDYGSNAIYFVTICTQNREHYFGEIADGKMELSKTGKIAQRFWVEIPHSTSTIGCPSKILWESYNVDMDCINLH